MEPFAPGLAIFHPNRNMENEYHPGFGNLATINGFELHTKAVCNGEPDSFLAVSHVETGDGEELSAESANGEIPSSCREAAESIAAEVGTVEAVPVVSSGAPAVTSHKEISKNKSISRIDM
ncbi:hypothetical protein Tco_0905364 [Tanacetum coccineum]